MSNFWGLFFHVFMGKNLILIFFLHCSVRTKKLLEIKGSFLEGIFFWIKNFFFLGLAVLGVCPLLLPLVSLIIWQSYLLFRSEF